MEPQNELDRLALLHGSDKFGSHYYTGHYDSCFAPLRARPLHLLEIGIGGYDDPAAGGASLRMWKDYFPSAQIYGLDWYAKPGVAEDRVKTYQGSQTDPVAMARILADTPDQAFDIIIDDGSHRSEHVIATFLMMFQYVKPGGWYVVEDIQTSYWSDHGGNSDDLNAPMISTSFFKQFVDSLNWREIHRPGYTPTVFDQTITSLRFYHNMVFVEKGSNMTPSNFVQNNRVPTAL
jgi:hypothetical protein